MYASSRGNPNVGACRRTPYTNVHAIAIATAAITSSGAWRRSHVTTRAIRVPTTDKIYTNAAVDSRRSERARLAAVDGDRRTGDPARPRRGHERDDIGDLH